MFAANALILLPLADCSERCRVRKTFMLQEVLLRRRTVALDTLQALNCQGAPQRDQESEAWEVFRWRREEVC